MEFKIKASFSIQRVCIFFIYLFIYFVENKNFYEQKQNINWASSLITSETEGRAELGSKKPKKSIWK